MKLDNQRQINSTIKRRQFNLNQLKKTILMLQNFIYKEIMIQYNLREIRLPFKLKKKANNLKKLEYLIKKIRTYNIKMLKSK